MLDDPGAPALFPSTRHSIVAALVDHGPDRHREALGRLAQDYWRPLYRYLRLVRRVDPEHAEDLVQSFFVHLVEKQVLTAYDPTRARLRTFLRVLLDRWVSNQRRDGQRLKRGGASLHLSIDGAGEESALATLADPVPLPAEEVFRQEWIRTLFTLALEDLRADALLHGRSTQFEVFERYDVTPADANERPTYEQLAATLGIAVTRVTNDLHAARRRFRRLLLERLAELCASEQEWREEARDLLGIELP